MEEAKKASFLEQEAGAGTEAISVRDLSRSFLKIAQALSSEVTEETIAGLKPGDFYSPLAGESFGTSIDVIVFKYERLYNVWKPNRGGLLTVLSVKEIESGKYKTYPSANKKGLIDIDGNDVVESRNFYVLVRGHEDLGLLIFPFQSTGLRQACRWLTKIDSLKTPQGRKAPIFQAIWRLETVKNKKDNNSWYQIGDKSTTTAEVAGYVCGDYIQKDGTVIKGLWTDEEAEATIMPLLDMCKDLDGTSMSIAAPANAAAIEDHSTGTLDSDV